MWKVQMGALHVLEEPLNTSDAHDTSLPVTHPPSSDPNAHPHTPHTHTHTSQGRRWALSALADTPYGCRFVNVRGCA